MVPAESKLRTSQQGARVALGPGPSCADTVCGGVVSLAAAWQQQASLAWPSGMHQTNERPASAEVARNVSRNTADSHRIQVGREIWLFVLRVTLAAFRV
jgi:hypothetical protein